MKKDDVRKKDRIVGHRDERKRDKERERERERKGERERIKQSESWKNHTYTLHGRY